VRELARIRRDWTRRGRSRPSAEAVRALHIAGGAADAAASSGAACDVWSAGCLLFELLTGSFLFHDDDWARFYFSVTGDATMAGGGGGSSSSTGGGVSGSDGTHSDDGSSSDGEEERLTAAAAARRGVSAAPALQAPLPIISDEKLELLRETCSDSDGEWRAAASSHADSSKGRFGLLSELLLSVLVRDPLRRPSVQRASRLVDAATAGVERAAHKR
jgi:serine/threonine protein kinase